MATDPEEQALIWKGRKSAFAAVGRISPDYIVQDGVIPRTALPEVLREMSRLAAERGIRVANVFHAGDGNLHPLVLFDDGNPGEAERAEEVSGAILDLCIERGGSITGEHGVGMEKQDLMCTLFTDSELELMKRLRDCFNPNSVLNPQKILPSVRSCREAVAPGHTSLNAPVAVAPELR